MNDVMARADAVNGIMKTTPRIENSAKIPEEPRKYAIVVNIDVDIEKVARRSRW